MAHNSLSMYYQFILVQFLDGTFVNKARVLTSIKHNPPHCIHQTKSGGVHLPDYGMVM